MKQRFLIALSLFALTAVVSVFLGNTGLASRWNAAVIDRLHDSTSSHGDEILLVAVDEKSLADSGLGRWQEWDRSIWGEAVSKVAAGKPKVIGVDVLFPEQSKNKKADIAFVAAVEKAGNVVLAEKVQDDGSVLSPFPALKNVAYTTAPINMNVSEDGIVRSVSPIFKEKGNGFSLTLVAQYLGVEPTVHDSAVTLTDTPIRLPENPKKKYGPIDIFLENGVMNIRFFGKPYTVSTVSMVDVVRGKVDLSRFSGKIVLLGVTSTTLHDEFLTPVSDGVLMPGVEIHANAIDTMLSGRFLVSQSQETVWWSTIFLALLFGTLFWRLSNFWGIVLLVFGLFSSLVATIILFESGIVLSFVTLTLTLVFTYSTTILFKLFWTKKERLSLSNAIGRYVSKDLAKEILEHPKELKLGGESREVTVLFSDIEGFTSISEGMPAEELVTLLNDYFEEMSKAVFATGGTLDKFIGDAVMAFWNAPVSDPKHAQHAVATALDMQRRAVLLRQKWRDEGKNWPAIHLRVGVNTGKVVVGNIGSKERFDYTIIGDAVNLGSRLEAINKRYGTKVLISQFTKEHLVDADSRFREVDTIAVKGKNDAVTIYEPLPEEDASFAEYEKGLFLYRSARFSEAKAAFKKSLIAHAEDGPSRLMLQRCGVFEVEPPKEWNGVWKWESK